MQQEAARQEHGGSGRAIAAMMLGEHGPADVGRAPGLCPAADADADQLPAHGQGGFTCN